uniref:Uncharacterized protein n=1 Tax=Cyprinus carpio TaxID=7962 RepID=A0A8C2JWL6_CYPCA
LTLHLEEKRFEKASEVCINNHYQLTIMAAICIKSAFLAAEEFNILNSKFWIGLALQKIHCTDFTEDLHSFRWTSEQTDSKYSNWKNKPFSTYDLMWSDGSCRDSAFYMCRFIFKGMCKPKVLEKPGDVKYKVRSYLNLAEIQCGGSEDAEYIFSVCDNKNCLFGWTNLKFFALNKTSTNNHLCFETAGAGVSCEYHEGYYLMDDKVSCALRNNCENSPCESKCIPTATGFSCACAEGFHLAEDSISCVDIDECQQRRPTCGVHRCHNTPGSYFCECNPSFRLVTGKCEDVNECNELICQQGCLNSQGSFSCYCHACYSSSLNDSGICVDIDECISRLCEDICVNTLGSLKCCCRENFIFGKNGISCVLDPTEKPQNSPSSDHREVFITKLNHENNKTTLGY